MTQQMTELIRRVELRVGELLEQRAALVQQVRRLQRELEEQMESNKKLQSQYDALSERHAQLKMAKYIDMADNDVKDLRGRVRQMVRDIDRCMAMLKADNNV